MILHNTMVPMAATENYADSVVAMEWGYARLASGAPAIEDLPLEWNFMGHRPRGVISYGCLEEGAPERVHRQMTMRSLLTGVTPWTADDLALEMFAPLVRRDLSGFRFADPRSAPASAGGRETAAAMYHGPEEALLLVGNLAPEQRSVRCRVDVTRSDLVAAERYVVRAAGTEVTLSAAQLREEGLEITVDGDGVGVASISPR